MNNKWIIRLALMLAVAGGVAYGVSPVLAARGLVKAARAGDEAALRRHVDFPAFRESLKGELNAEVVARMRADPRSQDSALGSLGLMLAPSLVSGMVDVFVTPQAVSAMVRTAEAPDADPDTPPPTAPEGSGDDIRTTYGYRDLNTFAITLTDPAKPDQRLDLLMQRRNLFGWKLAGIDLDAGEAG